MAVTSANEGRKLSSMSAEEQAAHRNWTSVLNSDLSSVEEKNRARRKLDEIEWKGNAGGVFKRLHEIEERVQSIELIRGGGKQQVTKKQMEDVRTELDTLAKTVEEDARNAITAQQAVNECKDEIRRLWGEWKKQNEGLAIRDKTIRDLVAKVDGQNTKFEKRLTALDAADAKLTKTLADLLGEVLDQAKTAIMAEAQSAAAAAVAELVGDADEDDSDD